MDDQALIDKVTARILALLSGESVELAPRHVLMLFSGASTGFVAGMEAIRRLSGSAHTLTVVLSPAASQIITEAQARKAGAVAVLGPGQWADAPTLVREADLLLIPTLSMSVAARLALGLMDSLVATLTLGALLAGKPVVAIRDGAEPGGRGGEVFGAVPGAAAPLRARLEGHLAALETFGVELVREPDFLLTMERRLIAGAAPRPAPGAALQTPTPAAAARAGFITEADLLGLMPGSTLRLAPGSRLTPQASDTAGRLRLVLETT
ncbi:MAG TPA: flavoprotein [Chloroflexaceae bacterium]|nr:flavoprotein [Chloroflexaceae bacterium]